jgi:hypothetical protein
MPSPRLCARTDQTEIAMSEADAPLGPPLARVGKGEASATSPSREAQQKETGDARPHLRSRQYQFFSAPASPSRKCHYTARGRSGH